MTPEPNAEGLKNALSQARIAAARKDVAIVGGRKRSPVVRKAGSTPSAGWRDILDRTGHADDVVNHQPEESFG